MASDRDRRQLFVALERERGDEPAGTLMELLPPVGWADVARTSELMGVRTELGGEISELRVEIRAEIAELRAELRSQLPKLYAANTAMAFATAGLVLAAAKLA